MPDAARHLLQVAALRQQAQALGIKRIEGNDKGGFIEFSQHNRVDPTHLISLLQRDPKVYRLDGPTRLKFINDLGGYPKRLTFITQLLEEMAQHTCAA
ncbi:hypothetical protein OS21_18550 [Dickeya oryzae]